jgi:hypothetical protein
MYLNLRCISPRGSNLIAEGFPVLTSHVSNASKHLGSHFKVRLEAVNEFGFLTNGNRLIPMVRCALPKVRRIPLSTILCIT